MDADVHDDNLSNVAASADDVAYECGWADGCDYGYRFAVAELEATMCETCRAARR